MVSNDRKDRDSGTFESLYLECYSTAKNTGSQPYHSSLRLEQTSYTGLKRPTAKGTSQVDLQISQLKPMNSLKDG